MKNSKLIFLFLIFLFSCKGHHSRFDVNVGSMDVPEVRIHRYGKALFEIDTSNFRAGLKQIQSEFPVFLSGSLNDRENVNKIRNFVDDTLLQAVYKDCSKTFGDLSFLEDDLTDAFKHYKFYFPEAPVPQVYTFISGFDYQQPVRIMGGNMLITLDLYLGENYSRYKELGLPLYSLRRFSKENITRDCCYTLAGQYLSASRTGNKLLDFMIAEGKKLWFTRAMIPEVSNEVLFDYTEAGVDWAENNEGLVWSFLIENKMLYSTDMINVQKFIREAPFTSFFGQDSPPRLGWWIGYEIVDGYMKKNPDISLAELMKTYDSQKLLKESGFKPSI